MFRLSLGHGLALLPFVHAGLQCRRRPARGSSLFGNMIRPVGEPSLNSAGAFFTSMETQNNPLAELTTFLEDEVAFEQTQQTDKMRFVGYVLDIGYESTTIITSDPFKVAVGGIPRGSFLILAPSDLEGLPPHFTLLRVTETAPTPLNTQVQQTYFELHKKSMPELDIWTQSELQWGALKCAVLGMFYPKPSDRSGLGFSGDVNSVVSAHRYKVYSPTPELLDIIVNGLVDSNSEPGKRIGALRPTENQLVEILHPQTRASATEVRVAIADFKGARTAMFGKTRLGKSNVVMLLVQAIINATKSDASVGQLIFDINGEYANDNHQTGSRSIRSANQDACTVYALTKRPNTPSEDLRLNFYEQPGATHEVVASLLAQANRTGDYITAFTSASVPNVEDIGALPYKERTRPRRLVQYYWAILHEAGFAADERRLGGFARSFGHAAFDPGFNKDVRAIAYGGSSSLPPAPSDLDGLVSELKTVIRAFREQPDNPHFTKCFKSEDIAMFNFLLPTRSGSSGPAILRQYRIYHSPTASNFTSAIIGLLNRGHTVILDLGNATDSIRKYFADMLSRAVFAEQEKKFTSNTLGNNYIQLYFEEAHNLFPTGNNDLTSVYNRFAKEGAKFHVGIVYSTQSPSTISKDLLVQTENFFVGHLSSSAETRSLSQLQVAFDGLEQEIMRSKTPGYMRMLTQSHRFVIPFQADLYRPGAS